MNSRTIPTTSIPTGAIPKCGQDELVLDCCYIDICVIFSSSGSPRMRLISQFPRASGARFSETDDSPETHDQKRRHEIEDQSNLDQPTHQVGTGRWCARPTEHRAGAWFWDTLLRLVSGFVGSRGIDQGVIHSEDSMLRVKERMKVEFNRSISTTGTRTCSVTRWQSARDRRKSSARS